MSTFVVYEPALYSWLGKLRKKKKIWIWQVNLPLRQRKKKKEKKETSGWRKKGHLRNKKCAKPRLR